MTLLHGRYELGELLGRGGLADVHLATDTLLGRQVAVKLLRDSAVDETDRSRFEAEARTVAALSHPALVTVLDAGLTATADRPFLVLELVTGPSLAGAIAHGPLPLDRVRAVGRSVASALEHAHAAGVVHRDVKPGNVLLRTDGAVKLADFGIARIAGDLARHTRTGTAVGTAAYLAPEQVRGQEVTGAADVYALGLTLLEALTAQRAYGGPPTEAALARLHRPPTVPDGLPAPVRDLVVAMTALEPADRPSPGAVVAALAEPRVAPSTAPPPPPVLPDRTRVRMRAAPVVVASPEAADGTGTTPTTPLRERLAAAPQEWWVLGAAGFLMLLLVVTAALA